MDAAKAIRHIKKVDPDLARAIRRIGVCDLVVDKSRTIYASLVRSIVYQQLTGKVAAIIFGRFIKLFPARKFPEPERVLMEPFEQLRGVGLSNQKVGYIQNIAQAATDGILPDSRQAHRMRDDELVVDRGVDHGVDLLRARPRRRRQARDSSRRLSSSPARGALGKVRLVSWRGCGEERALAPRANLCDARCARVAC